jgi:hypothetical protein
MRVLVIADTKITDEHLNRVQDDFTDLIKSTTGIEPDFYEMIEDFSIVPTEVDNDGDLKPTKKYTTALMKRVHDLYGSYGIDSVVMLVHRDNWVFEGIWGTNWSNLYYQYHVHLVRHDHKNLANTLGTLYHEWMHSLDALILTHTGVEIDTYFKNTKCFVDWDTTCVHGNKFAGCKETPYAYIKWKDNLDALRMITPDLKKAYKVRKELYLAPYRNALLQAMSFLRGLLNKKNGVPRGT